MFTDGLQSSHRRRGTMFVAVLGCAMIVTVIGVSAILVARVEHRVLSGCADFAAARQLAYSTIDMGLFTLHDDATWRTTKFPGLWRNNQAAGDGRVYLSVSDPIDANLSDAKWEPIVFAGTGALREARYILEATTIAEPLPLPALNTCLHTGGKLTVSLLNSITVSGAPLSMNGSVNGPGTITGTVHAGSIGVLPIILGSSVIPSTAKEMPDAGLFSMYQGLATTITGTTTIDRQVLTPTSNPWGAPNADGVYYIDAGSSDFIIKRSRIEGTLLIKCASGKKVRIEDPVYMYNYRSDYPVLIVDGALEVSLASATSSFSESSQGVNLNPVISPILNVFDVDEADTYPNEIQGLVHVLGTLTLANSSIVRGTILAHGNVTISGTPVLYHNAQLYSYPPMGYVTYAMKLASGSWRRVVNP